VVREADADPARLHPAPVGGDGRGGPCVARAPALEGHLRLLVLHDDGEREFAYTTGAEQALEQAAADGWTVVSIERDWAAVF
jgi:hypothetical protein